MKILFAILGVVSLGLGILGIFLPILPTTPFILLSAALFAKSSDRLYNWLLNHKQFGQILRTYREGNPIPLKVKIIATSFIWITILISVFTVAKDIVWLQIILLCLAFAISIYLSTFKPKKQ